jgi:hypothetical protein
LGGVASATLPAVPRYTFTPWFFTAADHSDTTQVAVHRKQALADQLCRWHDDLLYTLPKDLKLRPWSSSAYYAAGQWVTSGNQTYVCVVANTNQTPSTGSTYWTAAALGERPMAQLDSDGTQQQGGAISWFLTVGPTSQPGTYSVAVVVCNRRILTQRLDAGVYYPDGERAVVVEKEATTDANTVVQSPSYGGTTITYYRSNARAADIISCTPTMTGPAGTSGALPLKNDEWVLLYGVSSAGNITQATWYRVVHAGYTPDPSDPTKGSSSITLAGPDWYGGGPNSVTDPNSRAVMVVVGGVTGVYTSTVQVKWE